MSDTDSTSGSRSWDWVPTPAGRTRIDTRKVTRVVLVDYRDERPSEYPVVYEQWDLPSVDIDFQDDGRTLKVFVMRENNP